NEDVEKLEELMREKLKGIKEKVSTIKKGPFYDGIENFGDSCITIRVIAWTKETDRLHTVRELNKHLKIMFDQNNIEMPFPQLVIHQEKKE
ncbi:MAG: mechanosensitive ion channel family protein, partial [Tenericutes bacterium]|nr:mechanosensitive ion channel family protein [Mycoplasmatota bacterium]